RRQGVLDRFVCILSDWFRVFGEAQRVDQPVDLEQLEAQLFLPANHTCVEREPGGGKLRRFGQAVDVHAAQSAELADRSQQIGFETDDLQVAHFPAHGSAKPRMISNAWSTIVSP